MTAINGKAMRERGAAFEREVAAYFRAHRSDAAPNGYNASRTYGAGRPDDCGDLTVEAWAPLLVECKAVRKAERSAWMDAARVKLRDWGERFALPVIVEKRFGYSVGRAHVTMDLDGFLALLDAVAERSAEYARAPVKTPPAHALPGGADSGPSAPVR